MTKSPFSVRSSKKDLDVLEIVLSDVCGPMRVTSPGEVVQDISTLLLMRNLVIVKFIFSNTKMKIWNISKYIRMK